MKTGYFKPPIPISVKAMSITHITNKMVEDKEPFATSEMKRELQTLIERGGIIVAHNALFDIAMLKHESVEVPRFICTLRLARHLDQENKIPEYNLQYLRYFLDLDIAGHAHDAEGDVQVLEGVFNRLFKKMRETEESDGAVVEEMIEISSRPTVFTYFNFGKHKNERVEDVARTDREYLEWLLKQKTDAGVEPDDDWVFTLSHYLAPKT